MLFCFMERRDFRSIGRSAQEELDLSGQQSRFDAFHVLIFHDGVSNLRLP